MSLKLRRTKIITAIFNTEHLVTFRQISPTRAVSNSVATRIAEIADYGTPKEHELPQGEDRGFLWRWNAYWRYEQVPGGVIAECESISLSRELPPVVGLMIRPIVSGAARESMERTLAALPHAPREAGRYLKAARVVAGSITSEAMSTATDAATNTNPKSACASWPTQNIARSTITSTRSARRIHTDDRRCCSAHSDGSFCSVNQRCIRIVLAATTETSAAENSTRPDDPVVQVRAYQSGKSNTP